MQAEDQTGAGDGLEAVARLRHELRSRLTTIRGRADLLMPASSRATMFSTVP